MISIRLIIGYFIILIALEIFLNACTNPFKTRDVEDPDLNNTSDIYNQPFNSEIVLDNFYYSMIQKNITNYMLCLVDPSAETDYTYRFVPDPRSETVKFLNWNRDDEAAYLNTVFKQSTIIELSFLNTITYSNITQSPDSVQTNSFRYELKIRFEDRDEIYSGSARMKLVVNINGLWAIYFWEDIRVPNTDSQSWSDLKAAYKN